MAHTLFAFFCVCVCVYIYIYILLGGLGPLSPQKLAQEVRLSLTLIN
jgi:hypothetical protein